MTPWCGWVMPHQEYGVIVTRLHVLPFGVPRETVCELFQRFQGDGASLVEQGGWIPRHHLPNTGDEGSVCPGVPASWVECSFHENVAPRG